LFANADGSLHRSVDAFQNEPAGKILELCILHLAMSEMAVLETRHQIVINEVYLKFYVMKNIYHVPN